MGRGVPTLWGEPKDLRFRDVHVDTYAFVARLCSHNAQPFRDIVSRHRVTLRYGEIRFRENRERERSKRHETLRSILVYKSTLCSTRLASITLGCPVHRKVLIKTIQSKHGTARIVLCLA